VKADHAAGILFFSFPRNTRSSSLEPLAALDPRKKNHAPDRNWLRRVNAGVLGAFAFNESPPTDT
jgi:hypothetical protein